METKRKAKTTRRQAAKNKSVTSKAAVEATSAEAVVRKRTGARGRNRTSRFVSQCGTVNGTWTVTKRCVLSHGTAIRRASG